MLSTWCSCLGKSEAVVLINVVFNLKKTSVYYFTTTCIEELSSKLLLGREK